jgi:protein transport protein SEC24
MFVISDLDDIFLPVESGLLVNLTECREQVEMLLESLPHMHKETTDVECVLGPAIDAATKVIYKVGGKMQVRECVCMCMCILCAWIYTSMYILTHAML